MADRLTPKQELEKLTRQEEKILSLLRNERRLAKEKFPLAYALIATFGLVATISGFNKWIDKVEFLKQNPIILIAVGVIILILTGTAYRKIS